MKKISNSNHCRQVALCAMINCLNYQQNCKMVSVPHLLQHCSLNVFMPQSKCCPFSSLVNTFSTEVAWIGVFTTNMLWITLMLCIEQKMLKDFQHRPVWLIKVVIFNYSSLTCFGQISRLQKDIVNIFGNQYYTPKSLQCLWYKYYTI
jgi:hypothetical protein